MSQEIACWPATVPDGAAGAAEALRAYKRALQLHRDAAEADVGKRRKAARRARATRARAALANGVADGGAGEDPALATVRGRGASGLAALRQMVLGLLPNSYSLRLWASCCIANLICLDALHLKPCRFPDLAVAGLMSDTRVHCCQRSVHAPLARGRAPFPAGAAALVCADAGVAQLTE